MDKYATLMGKDYAINQYITIRQPSLGEIADMTERNYWSVVSAFTLTPSDIKAALWDKGIDWEKISDFELFASVVTSLSPDSTKILFGDLDFTKFKLCNSPQTGEIVLVHTESGIIIDAPIHHKIAEFVAFTHAITRRTDKAKNEETKQILIEVNRQDVQDRNEAVDKDTGLQALVSGMVCYPGFAYTYESIQNITYYQLIQSAQRAQIYTSTIALLQGAYSGMCDTSKIDKTQFNWLRSIHS